MARFSVLLAQTVEQYAEVTVEADNEEEAEELAREEDANGHLNWKDGDCHDFRVADVMEEVEDAA